jgi:hypothetical protein
VKCCRRGNSTEAGEREQEYEYEHEYENEYENEYEYEYEYEQKCPQPLPNLSRPSDGLERSREARRRRNPIAIEA